MNKNILLPMIIGCSLLLISHHVLATNIDNRIDNNPSPLTTPIDARTIAKPKNDARILALTTHHPDKHIVVRGDTLWDISTQFLKDPWQWPHIWKANPAIKNPHLIYPGDIILLKMINGQPVLWLERGPKDTQTAGGLTIVRLSPRIRSSQLKEEAIPAIPSDAIKQFLKFPRIINKRELDNAGYLVASEDGGLISGTNDIVYARGIEPQEQTRYDIVRPGKVYRRKKGWRNEILGYEMLRIASAQVTRYSDPSTMIITDAKREVLIGDRLLPITEERDLNVNYLPHAPENAINGKIIAVLDGVSRIGQYHTVVINLGTRDHIETGHVLAIYQAGNTVRDNITRKWNKNITLPDERAGTLMIVHTFDRLSYALIMEAHKDMKVFDSISNP